MSNISIVSFFRVPAASPDSSLPPQTEDPVLMRRYVS